MQFLQPVGDPRARRRASWVFDGLLALFTVAFALPAGAGSPHQSGVPWPVALGVDVALAVPLVFRRSWPVPVFGLVWLIGGLAGLFDVRLASNLALVIALFTVAALCSRRETIIATGLLELGVIVASIILAGSSWWISAIFLSGMVAAAVGLGLYRGTRQAYLVELQDRADRLERERDQQGELAAAAERARIAREMHDIVAHHLTVMVALSDGAVAAFRTSPERAADVMRTVSATGRQALADTRRLLGVLRDDSNRDAGAVRAPTPELADLDALVARVREAGLTVGYEVQGVAGELAPAVQLTIYRLVQEALTNTLKHGGTDARAMVRLHYLPDEVRLEVEDDGAGAAGPQPIGLGRGLAGMRERVQAFGGDVTSGPRAPGGWRVSANLRPEATGSR